MNLIIVESPTKAKTIQKFLSNDYVVKSSFGHVRDLPKSDLGIDVEHDFAPHYVIPIKARPHVKELKEPAGKAKIVILATDQDREGEAIAWHLSQALQLAKENMKRIVFHEITKSAIDDALTHPREIDMNLVDAQQARRVLDRLVGYKLSPFLWKKVARGLSAGRVQSVAVRLIVDREREIETFKRDEYWTIQAELRQRGTNAEQKRGTDAENFTANLHAKNGEAIQKLGIKTKEEADKILEGLKQAQYKVEKVERKEMKRNPLPPFATSTLQQEAAKRFHMPAKMTMSIAQSLYEKGYITYHRTDSLNLSEQSLVAAKQFIEKEFGTNYYSARTFKTRAKGAQEAHEAIRPTSITRAPDAAELEPRQKKIYGLIWRRFLACQMAQASFDATVVDVTAKNYTFRANGSVLKFDGFLKAYPMKFQENELPELIKDEALELLKLIPSQHFTEPPPRYSEATLIRELEKNGIGRPSTYAPTVSTIQERNYVQKNEQRRFAPTEIGIKVNDLLVEHFPQIVDIQFTAMMEENLDTIAQGKRGWVPLIREFYQPFDELLQKKYAEVQKEEPVQEKTGKLCPECLASPDPAKRDNHLIIRFGRFGKFYACSGFPACRHTEPLEKKIVELGIKCPKCLQGDLIQKQTRRKKIFYSCNRYPSCDFALWDKPVRSTQGEPTGEKCPKCGSLLIEKFSKKSEEPQITCSNKECV